MIEWLGRKAIVSIVQKTKTSKKYLVQKKELKNIIPNVVQDKNWFYNIHELNHKLKLAFQIRYENQQYRLKKWIKASQDLTNSIEIIELAKMIGKDQVNRLNNIRKNMMNLLNDLIKPKTEKVYILKKQLIKKKSTIISYANKNVSKLEIFFPKRQIIENLKNKGIVNLKGMPSVPMHKIMLPVYQIINGYVNILKGLVFYYCCVTNLTSLKRLVNGILRYSLLATIGVKYKKSIKGTIENFGFNPKIVYKNKVIANFPAAGGINSRKKEYLNKMGSNINLYSKIKNERIQFNHKIIFFEKSL